MYGILHIPTGKFLMRPAVKGTDRFISYPIDYMGSYSFYSKKEAERYKRAFIVYCYWYLRNIATTKPLNIPKRAPRFLKRRNKEQRYPFTFSAFDLGNRSLDFYPVAINEQRLYKAVLPNEFMVVFIS